MVSFPGWFETPLSVLSEGSGRRVPWGISQTRAACRAATTTRKVLAFLFLATEHEFGISINTGNLAANAYKELGVHGGAAAVVHAHRDAHFYCGTRVDVGPICERPTRELTPATLAGSSLPAAPESRRGVGARSSAVLSQEPKLHVFPHAGSRIGRHAVLRVVAIAVPVTPFLLGITGAVWIVRGVIGLASPTY